MAYFRENQTAVPASVAPIPPSIVRAVCALQATLEAVRKSGRNQHGGYQFASTDDIYAAITRKMGEVGLMILPLEEVAETVRIEKEGKTQQWLRAVFSFVVATEEATWHDPRSRRTLFIQVTGPQTFQAAQSYVEKAYLRSLFKIPTGDMDLDSMPQAETEEEQAALVEPRKRKSSAAAKRDGGGDVFNEIRRHIAGAGDVDSLRFVRQSYTEEWATAPARWSEILDHEYEDRMQSLGAVEEPAQ